MHTFNKHFSPLAVLIAGLVTGCESPSATKPSASAASADSRPCVANLTQEGSFFTGKTYKTHQDFPVGDKAKAVDRLTAALAADGWQIISSSKESGVLSASQGVSYGQGKTVPLNAVVTESGSGGIRVSLVFVTSGGLVASEKDLRNQFCKLLEAVGL